MVGCRPLSDPEIRSLLKSLKTPRDKALVVIGLKSGFRISEILTLKVSDVFRYGRFVERITVSRRNMKGKVKSRSVPVHEEIKKCLSELIRKMGLKPHDFLFQSRKGENKPITRIQAWRILKAAAEANHLDGKIATHSLRKTFASKLYLIFDRDLVKTKEALGHVSINSTVSYLSFDQAEIEEAILSA